MSANAHLGNCSIRLDQGHSGFKGRDRRRAFFCAATAIFVWVLLSSIGASRAMSAEQFIVQLTDGKILFNENDVESYSAATNTFILSPASSKRLVSNWAAFIKDDERVKPEGEYFDAAERNSAFQVMLGDKQLANGIVASLDNLYSAHGPGVVLYGAMPLVTNERMHLGIGKMTGDFKDMIERGPEFVFEPVLGAEVSEHFRKLGKLK